MSEEHEQYIFQAALNAIEICLGHGVTIIKHQTKWHVNVNNFGDSQFRFPSLTDAIRFGERVVTLQLTMGNINEALRQAMGDPKDPLGRLERMSIAKES